MTRPLQGNIWEPQMVRRQAFCPAGAAGLRPMPMTADLKELVCQSSASEIKASVKNTSLKFSIRHTQTP